VNWLLVLVAGDRLLLLADFVILDRDIMTVPESEILGTNVVATYIGGRAVFERGR
jgi:predicted amidohydrolase YtcJ